MAFAVNGTTIGVIHYRFLFMKDLMDIASSLLLLFFLFDLLLGFSLWKREKETFHILIVLVAIHKVFLPRARRVSSKYPIFACPSNKYRIFDSIGSQMKLASKIILIGCPE